VPIRALQRLRQRFEVIARYSLNASCEPLSYSVALVFQAVVPVVIMSAAVPLPAVPVVALSVTAVAIASMAHSDGIHLVSRTALGHDELEVIRRSGASLVGCGYMD